jgi:hypothetical protein
MTNALIPALSYEALLDKSKMFIARAIKRKIDEEYDEYQLWASLALELVGKAALAERHPSLIVDPTHSDSIFAAAGVKISTDVKTISAHTLFDRIRKLSPQFDTRVLNFCLAISQRRNAELHSGEAPFRAMKQEAWEAQYWDAAQVVLSLMNLSLDEWVGASAAKAPKEIVEHARTARRQSAKIRVERAAAEFNSRPRADRKRAIADAKVKRIWHYPKLFTLLSDTEWEVECPACHGKAFVAGIQVHEEVLNVDRMAEAGWELVERHYTGEQFRCTVCNLVLEGTDELEAAEIEAQFEDTHEREMVYEPDYGND